MRLHGAAGVGVGVVTGKSDVEEVRLGAQLSEGARDVRLKVVPAETEVLRGPHLDVVPLVGRRGGVGKGGSCGVVVGAFLTFYVAAYVGEGSTRH